MPKENFQFTNNVRCYLKEKGYAVNENPTIKPPLFSFSIGLFGANTILAICYALLKWEVFEGAAHFINILFILSAIGIIFKLNKTNAFELAKAYWDAYFIKKNKTGTPTKKAKNYSKHIPYIALFIFGISSLWLIFVELIIIIILSKTIAKMQERYTNEALRFVEEEANNVYRNKKRTS